MADVRSLEGTPVAADFGYSKTGTPIIVDITAGAVAAYVLDAAGAVQSLGGGGGGGAPTNATYVTLSTNATLTNERVLTAGANITLTDNGPGNTLVITATGGGGGGSVASGSATVDFGFASGLEGDIASVSVSLPSVVATSEIGVSPRYLSSLTDHDPEDYAIEGITAIVGTVTAGVGFDIIASAPRGTWGQYNVDYLVNV